MVSRTGNLPEASQLYIHNYALYTYSMQITRAHTNCDQRRPQKTVVTTQERSSSPELPGFAYTLTIPTVPFMTWLVVPVMWQVGSSGPPRPRAPSDSSLADHHNVATGQLQAIRYNVHSIAMRHARMQEQRVSTASALPGAQRSDCSHVHASPNFMLLLHALGPSWPSKLGRDTRPLAAPQAREEDAAVPLTALPSIMATVPA